MSKICTIMIIHSVSHLESRGMYAMNILVSSFSVLFLFVCLISALQKVLAVMVSFIWIINISYTYLLKYLQYNRLTL